MGVLSHSLLGLSIQIQSLEKISIALLIQSLDRLNISAM